jgi:hypothetical protein
MSDRIHIKPTEHGVVRIFDVDLPSEGITGFNLRNGTWPLRDALGAESLDPAHIDLIAVEDLGELGLAGYLAEGHGISPEDLHEMRGRLAALSGHVLIVTSRAFGGLEQTLSPRAPLHLVATFTEDRPPVSFDPLPSGAARGLTGGKPPPSDAAMSGRVASVALLVLFALVALVVWVAS